MTININDITEKDRNSGLHHRNDFATGKPPVVASSANFEQQLNLAQARIYPNQISHAQPPSN
ncbi:hypothetical protein [Mesorhizobium sp. M6A.T.Ce.TU.016.01.1.1]|uniref:hypothetical protein n=1 Tax=Mesorhizobium sp. M6A.T.Ce.TU.016.01.1.1 TaxID=2496783 RepID=UPI000FCCBDB3|nr:hypothetical protein [Mesorhizobium sp. M6A.T.Ce.TU.016.01.1.1]RUU25956.1 hypothetical protein EOC94_29455 [Mesorhizobium sp. M6A.T.Ce.TU.016.01.1.1]